MKYTEAYIMNHDIDWFCVVNGIYIHVASAGGMLPSQINDIDKLRDIQHQVQMLPDIYSEEEIEYNDFAIDNVVGENNFKARQLYVESFVAMARKGFASFDRTNISEFSNNLYHLVCWPKGFERKPQGIELFNPKIDDGKKEEHVLFITLNELIEKQNI